tara:strand:+ start:7241 stop:7549 length:309 start_codon:yes stop_codon:yes gene_type:complete
MPDSIIKTRLYIKECIVTGDVKYIFTEEQLNNIPNLDTLEEVLGQIENLSIDGNLYVYPPENSSIFFEVLKSKNMDKKSICFSSMPKHTEPVESVDLPERLK